MAANAIGISNGRTFSINLPSIEGQEAVIRKAYSKAGIPLCETDYVEVRLSFCAI